LTAGGGGSALRGSGAAGAAGGGATGAVAHPATTSAHIIAHVTARARNASIRIAIARISRTRIRFVGLSLGG
jgi:hypothetical protein